MKKKLLVFILAAVLVVSAVAGCTGNSTPSTSSPSPSSGNTPNNPGDEVPVQGKVIVGSTTSAGGSFRWPAFGVSSPNAADSNVNTLTTGYGTMEVDASGSYQWNKTSVKSHTEEEDADGNLVLTIEINEGLKFSDGSEVKAANYLAYVLAFSTQVAEEAGANPQSGYSFVGYDAFYEYVGEGSPEGAAKEFAGIRLLGDYKFSLTIDAAKGLYPYYYADIYGAVDPYYLGLVLGDGVEVKDDGNGAYLSDAWYEHTTTKNEEGADVFSFAKKDHLLEAKADVSKYPYSGPYTITNWDESTQEVTLTINKEYQGNYEGQKPHIETIVYTYVVSETMIDALATGQVDVLDGLTEGARITAALDLYNNNKDKFKENHYNRAGYGKIQFDCDFSPTMFAEVRQAVSYLLDKNDFATTFTEGYGATIAGPFAVDLAVWKAVRDTIKLNNYDFSVAAAKKALEDGGWIYNSKGEAYVEGQSGVDSVRYKKLTAEEATDLNIDFASVENTDGVEYKTVEVNGEYYMPLVINWFASENNAVSELIYTKLATSDSVKEAGLVIRRSVGSFNALLGEIYREPAMGFNGETRYSMYNLATSFTSEIYDYSYNWSLDPAWFDNSVNKLFDEYDVAFPYYDENGNHNKLSYADALKASDGKLGMDYMSMAMVYDATTEEEFTEWWKAYIERWNELVPDIPLYANIYYDVYSAKIENLNTTAYRGATIGLLYAYVK